MTVNPKPNELPAPIQDIDPLTRPLILDFYLTRADVVDRIIDHLDLADHPDVDPVGGSLDWLEIAIVLRELDDDVPDDKRPRTIAHQREKYRIIQRLGDLIGFQTWDDQAKLRKSQAIHVLLFVVTGESPDRFILPSDPDDLSTSPETTITARPDP